MFKDNILVEIHQSTKMKILKKKLQLLKKDFLKV